MSDPKRRKEQSAKTVAYHQRKKKEDPEYAEKSKARSKRYYHKIKNDPAQLEKIRERSRRQYHAMKKDPERHKAYLARCREYIQQRKRKDPEFAIRGHLRARLSHLFRLNKCTKSTSAIELTGISISELRIHLENQFLPGMSWKNYGSEWHIDHIVPCAHFDLTDQAQKARCFNYLNLRPCWAGENLRKNARILEDSQLPLGI